MRRNFRDLGEAGQVGLTDCTQAGIGVLILPGGWPKMWTINVKVKVKGLKNRGSSYYVKQTKPIFLQTFGNKNAIKRENSVSLF